MFVIATEHDLVVAVAVDVGDDRRGVRELRSIAAAPPLLRQRQIVVGLDGSDHPIRETLIGRERRAVTLEHPESDRIVRGHDVKHTVAIEITRTDVLVVATEVPALLRGIRGVAGVVDLRPVRVHRAVQFVNRGGRSRARLVREDLDDPVAVDIRRCDAANFVASAEVLGPPRHQLAGVVVHSHVHVRVAVRVASHGDLHVAVLIKVPDDGRGPHAAAPVFGRIRGGVRPGRLPQQRAVGLPDVEHRVASGDDIELAVAVDVGERGGSEPVLIPARGERCAECGGLHVTGRTGRRGCARGGRRGDGSTGRATGCTGARCAT